jgi:hypothetical protein
MMSYSWMGRTAVTSLLVDGEDSSHRLAHGWGGTAITCLLVMTFLNFQVYEIDRMFIYFITPLVLMCLLAEKVIQGYEFKIGKASA